MKKRAVFLFLFLLFSINVFAQGSSKDISPAVRPWNIKFAPMELADPFTPGLRMGLTFIPKRWDYKYGFQAEYTHKVAIFSPFKTVGISEDYYKIDTEFQRFLGHSPYASHYAALNVLYVDNRSEEEDGWFKGKDNGYYLFKDGTVKKDWIGVVLKYGRMKYDVNSNLYVDFYGGIGFRTVFSSYKSDRISRTTEETLNRDFPGQLDGFLDSNIEGIHTWFYFSVGVKLGFKF
jgi:hypothetical protein